MWYDENNHQTSAYSTRPTRSQLCLYPSGSNKVLLSGVGGKLGYGPLSYLFGLLDDLNVGTMSCNKEKREVNTSYKSKHLPVTQGYKHVQNQ